MDSVASYVALDIARCRLNLKLYPWINFLPELTNNSLFIYLLRLFNITINNNNKENKKVNKYGYNYNNNYNNVLNSRNLFNNFSQIRSYSTISTEKKLHNTPKKVYVYLVDIDNQSMELLSIFDSILKTAQSLNTSRMTIHRYASGNKMLKLDNKNFIVSFEPIDINTFDIKEFIIANEKIKLEKKPRTLEDKIEAAPLKYKILVYKYDNDELLVTYPSQAQAARSLGLARSSLQRCIEKDKPRKIQYNGQEMTVIFKQIK
ncbi:hypothetical protein (mitochondrion) [Ogataea philodendri]|uniref:Nuclease-associated modular DNA-binding 1 domain-containing protein n=1 Tax=Ogataea philodendri TaxID=1378263 RepID=S5U5L6_9ASCO|nr:hypothetical protein [Ogataea philodendri]AGS44401.1 hypothetical protein [Ogataea philodendri]